MSNNQLLEVFESLTEDGLIVYRCRGRSAPDLPGLARQLGMPLDRLCPRPEPRQRALDTATKYRHRATLVRLRAKSAKTLFLRQDLLELANEYDRRAEAADAAYVSRGPLARSDSGVSKALSASDDPLWE